MRETILITVSAQPKAIEVSGHILNRQPTGTKCRGITKVGVGKTPSQSTPPPYGFREVGGFLKPDAQRAATWLKLDRQAADKTIVY